MKYPSDERKLIERKSFRTGHRVVAINTEVSVRTLREWRNRLELRPRDLTAAICGDPLPGYSALDRVS